MENKDLTPFAWIADNLLRLVIIRGDYNAKYAYEDYDPKIDDAQPLYTLAQAREIIAQEYQTKTNQQ